MFLLLMDVSLPLFLIPSPSKYIHTCIHTYIQSCVVEKRKAGTSCLTAKGLFVTPKMGYGINMPNYGSLGIECICANTF